MGVRRALKSFCLFLRSGGLGFAFGCGLGGRLGLGCGLGGGF